MKHQLEKIPKNFKPPVEFEKKTGLTGISKNWNIPRNLTSDELFDYLLRYNINNNTIELSNLFNELVELNHELSHLYVNENDVKWSILQGCVSHFNYQDIFEFSILNEYYYMKDKEYHNRISYIQNKLGGIYFGWVLSNKTIELLETKTKHLL